MKSRLVNISHQALIFALAILVVSALAGCGFHLRGSDALPAEMSVTYIQSGSPFGTLVDDFATALSAHGVRVTEDRAEATAVLRILENNRGRDILSVNTSGKVLEYELRQTIQFSIMTAENLPVMEPQTVTLTQAYLYRSADVLSSEREKVAVRNSLQKNLVNMAMLRVAAAAR